MRAAEKVFYDDQGNPVVIDEQVAGFSPDQLQAMQMQREALGMQDPYLQGAGQAFGAGTKHLKKAYKEVEPQLLERWKQPREELDLYKKA